MGTYFVGEKLQIILDNEGDKAVRKRISTENVERLLCN